MTVLIPMSTEAYVIFVKAGVLGYAKENVESGRWPEEGAFERSQADYNKLLPQGLETPNNYLFEIKVDDVGSTVGFLWFAVEENHGQQSAFIYDIEIKQEFRRQGHAKAAFEALEVFVSKLGLTSISLHVFSHNLEAQALYKKLGFEVTGLNMLKKFDTNSS